MKESFSFFKSEKNSSVKAGTSLNYFYEMFRRNNIGFHAVLLMLPLFAYGVLRIINDAKITPSHPPSPVDSPDKSYCLWETEPLDERSVRPEKSLKLLHEALGKSKKNRRSIVACCGMGGAGKTHLMKVYFYEAESPVSLWIESENNRQIEQIVEAFLISKKIISTRDQKPEDLKRKFKEWQILSKEEILLCFDNAEDFISVSDWVSFGSNMKVIVTTRDSNFGEGECVRIVVAGLSKDESLRLLKKHYDYSESEQNDAEELVNILQYIPLIIMQAGDYIRSQNISIVTMIDKYHNEAIGMMKQLNPDASIMHDNVWKTFLLDYQKLAQTGNQSALYLWLYCGFISPVRIPRLLLFYLYKSNRDSQAEKFSGDLSFLIKLGLLQKDGRDFFKIHRNVQYFLRHQVFTVLKSGRYFVESAMRAFVNVIDDCGQNGKADGAKYVEHGKRIYFYAQEFKLDEKPVGLNSFSVDGSRLSEELERRENQLPAVDNYERSTPLYLNFLSYLVNTDIAYYGNFSGNKHHCDELIFAVSNFTYPDSASLGWVYRVIASTLSYDGYYILAETYYIRSLRTLEEVHGKDFSSWDTSVTLHGLGRLYLEIGKFDKAKETLNRSVVMCRETFGQKRKSHRELAVSYLTLGVLYTAMRQYDDVDSNLQTASSMLSDIIKIEGYSSDRDRASLYEAFGNFYIEKGEFSKAKKYLDDAIIYRENLYGKEASHPELAWCIFLIGKLYYFTYEYDKASEYFLKSLSQYRITHGLTRDKIKVASIYYLMGSLEFDRGNIEGALFYYKQSVYFRAQVPQDENHLEYRDSLKKQEQCEQKLIIKIGIKQGENMVGTLTLVATNTNSDSLVFTLTDHAIKERIIRLEDLDMFFSPDLKNARAIVTKLSRNAENNSLAYYMAISVLRKNPELISLFYNLADKNFIQAIQEFRYKNLSMLDLAGATGDVGLVKEMTTRLRFFAPDESNLLHVASYFGHLGIVQAAFNEGYTLTTPITVNYFGYPLEVTPLGLAILGDRIDVIEDFLTREPTCLQEVTPKLGNVIHLAILAWRHKTLDWLVRRCLSDDRLRPYLSLEHECGFYRDVEDNTERSLTPLALAAYLGNRQAMMILIATTVVDVSQKLKANNDTALHIAVRAAQESAVDLLIHSKANLNIQNRSGENPEALAKRLKNTHSNIVNISAIFAGLQRARNIQIFFEYRPFNYQQIVVRNLVLKGGGSRGFAYVGALDALETQFQQQTGARGLSQLRRVAGTSSGAITALLIAIGCTAEEVRDYSEEKNIEDFAEGVDLDSLASGGIQKGIKEALLAALKASAQGSRDRSWVMNWILHPISSGNRMTKLSGLATGEEFLRWIEDVIERKTGNRNLTLGEFGVLVKSDWGKLKHIYIVATQISPTQDVIIFSSEDSRYAHVRLADAVRASMSIPFFFAPHQILLNGPNNVMEGCYFVDGGLLMNFPLKLFDELGFQRGDLDNKDERRKFPIFNEETLGLRLTDVALPRHSNIEQELGDDPSMWELIKKIVGLYYDGEETVARATHAYAYRVVNIDALGVSFLDFKVPEDKKADLVKSGRDSILKFYAAGATAPAPVRRATPTAIFPSLS